MTNSSHGSTLDSLFEELGEREEVRARAIKRSLVYAVQRQMKKKRFSKARLAEALRTSRSQLDRILDEDDTSITLNTIVRLAAVLDVDAILDFEAVAASQPYLHVLEERVHEDPPFASGSYAETFSPGTYVIANEVYAA
jgi:antitoxin HicB